MNNYGILINTCDKFDDCWQPYFKLHAKYWPDCTARLYLNTETKDFSYPGLNIVALKVANGEGGRRLTWSECLLKALDKIEEEVVLYMQEDYFLKASVKNDLIEKYVQLMHGDKSIHCIHLTDQGPEGEGVFQCHNMLYEIPRIHRDRISCQAALWKKDVLRQYIRKHESAWNFEWFGSKRAGVLKHNFYAVDRSVVKLDDFEIIPYLFTGVIGGRWYKKVIPLFEANSITVDYSRRGFFEPHSKTFMARLKAKIKRLPIELYSYLSLLILRMRVGS